VSSMNYERITQERLPGNIVRWDVPPQNQGQIVEVAYAVSRGQEHELACRGAKYMRVHDRSVGPKAYTYYRLAEVSP
jgi:hypothetical protein